MYDYRQGGLAVCLRSWPRGSRARRSLADRCRRLARDPGIVIRDLDVNVRDMDGVIGHWCRVEAAPRPAMAGRAGRSNRGQDRVAVAVEGEVDDPEHVGPSSRPCASAVRAIVNGSGAGQSRAWPRAPPRRCKRPSAPGRRPRPGQQPAPDHRRPNADRGSCPDARGRPDRDSGRRHRRLDLGDRVDPAMEDRSLPRTASTPPSRTAATKSAGDAAPPDAMTGTETRSTMARRRCRLVARLCPISLDRGDQQLAAPELRRHAPPR